MRKTYYLLLAALLLVTSCKPKSQPEPQKEEETPEENSVGTPSISFQQLEIAIEASTVLADGNIVGFGKANAHSIRRIIKLSSTDGSVTWTKVIPNLDISIIQSIIAKNDGGFVLSGTKMENSVGYAILLSYDKDGNQQWRKAYAQPNKASDQTRVILADGTNMMLAATRYVNNTVGDIWLVKVNSSGDTIFTRNNVVRRPLSPPYIIRNGDDTYRILYSPHNGVGIEAMLLTLNSNGTLTDSTELENNGVTPYLEGILHNNSETICFGHDWANPDRARGLVMRLNSNFDVIQKTHYPSDSLHLLLKSAISVTNGYMICGWEGYDEKGYPFVMKIANDGTVQWKKTLDPISNKTEHFATILKHGNRQILIGNSTIPGTVFDEKAFILDINENGDMVDP